MTRCDYPELDETLFRETLENGLTVLVVPRPGFIRKTAYFVTDFGSIHTDFCLAGHEIHAPAGTAHFLEHKMFDLPGGRDVSEELAALGANANAFTSYDMTAYYFSCTENFDAALRLLLELVTTPCFSEKSIQKELGIIDQEIGMNDDAPDSRAFDNLMGAMYKRHPIRVPILGTCESIRQITPELLYDCHRAFYTPANMVLCVVGDVDADAVVAAALEITGTAKRPPAEKLRQWHEQPEAYIPLAHARMEVAMPTFELGFKCAPAGCGEFAARCEIIGDLAAEALFGESSALYLQLYSDGLIDSSFGGGYETVDGMAALLCSGDSLAPEAVRDAILAKAEILAREGVPETDFARMKRSALGRRIRELDSFDSTCFRLCAYQMIGYDYFSFPQLYRSVTSEEIRAFLAESVHSERCALSIIEPQEEAIDI